MTNKQIHPTWGVLFSCIDIIHIKIARMDELYHTKKKTLKTNSKQSHVHTNQNYACWLHVINSKRNRRNIAWPWKTNVFFFFGRKSKTVLLKYKLRTINILLHVLYLHRCVRKEILGGKGNKKLKNYIIKNRYSSVLSIRRAERRMWFPGPSDVGNEQRTQHVSHVLRWCECDAWNICWLTEVKQSIKLHKPNRMHHI